MRTFRPAARPSKLRVVLALLLPLVVIVPMSGLAALTFGMTRASYTIAGGALTVKSGDFFAGTRTVPLSDITEARAVVLGRGRRTAGTALPGFCAGRFSYSDLGAVWQVTTCRAHAVLVRAAGLDRPIVITPPDPDQFLSDLRAGTETVINLPPPDKGPLRWLAATLGPLAILSALGASALLLLGPGRMEYRVGEGVLEVRTLFGAKRWPARGARARAYTPGRLWRVAGAAAPGYYTGLYRESGESTRVYATAVDRVVLFEGEARVLVNPEDRVGFLRALEEEGASIEKHA